MRANLDRVGAGGDGREFLQEALAARIAGGQKGHQGRRAEARRRMAWLMRSRGLIARCPRAASLQRGHVVVASPKYPLVAYTLAYLHAKRGDFARALACSDRALALKP